MAGFQKILSELFQSWFSLIKVILLSKFSVKLPKADSGGECVILGNGPSLNISLKDNHDFLSSGKRKIFAVNTFCFSEYFKKLKPSFYVITAPEFYLENTTEFHIQQRDKVFAILGQETDWPMVLLMPAAAEKSSVIRNSFNSNKNIQLSYFNSTPVEGIQTISHLLFKANLGMPRPHNVLIPSIFLSLNMGHKTVYLFGADHSWHEEIRVGEDNKATVNHQHFYENKPFIMPMYKLDGQEYFIHDIFRKLHLAFKGYFVLSSYAESLGAKIYNASAKSYIDAFPKVKIGE